MVKQYEEQGHQVISAQDARQGDIILRTRGMKLAFIAAMAALVVIAVLMVVVAMP
tara:strand:+ start:2610 stop:2774 length:165 start_codon:yes stop_codon:yes gene_type:complete